MLFCFLQCEIVLELENTCTKIERQEQKQLSENEERNYKPSNVSEEPILLISASAHDEDEIMVGIEVRVAVPQPVLPEPVGQRIIVSVNTTSYDAIQIRVMQCRMTQQVVSRR